MWTEEDVEGLMENATIRKCFRDGELRFVRIIAHDGYAIHFIADEGYTDEEGNYYPPSYSYQVITALEDIVKYEAVLITPGMEVYDKPNNEEIA